MEPDSVCDIAKLYARSCAKRGITVQIPQSCGKIMRVEAVMLYILIMFHQFNIEVLHVVVNKGDFLYKHTCSQQDLVACLVFVHLSISPAGYLLLFCNIQSTLNISK